MFLLLAIGAMISILFIIMEFVLRKVKQRKFWLSNVKGIDPHTKVDGILKRDAMYVR